MTTGVRLAIFENETKKGYHLILIPQLEGRQEAEKLLQVIEFLKNRFSLKPHINMLQFGMPPYLKFEQCDGVTVTVALDDFDGLSIDSNSRDFLERLKPLLEKEIFANEIFLNPDLKKGK